MSSMNFSALYNTLTGGNFSNLLGGTASLPNIKSTAPGLPLQDVLFNAFQNRQSIFSPSVKASGSPDATFGRAPMFQEGLGGGLRWSYDPNWLTGIPQAGPFVPQRERVYGGLEDVLSPMRRPATVEPVAPVVTAPPTTGWPGNDIVPPMPPPMNPNGHWKWLPNAGRGKGEWIWVQHPR